MARGLAGEQHLHHWHVSGDDPGVPDIDGQVDPVEASWLGAPDDPAPRHATMHPHGVSVVQVEHQVLSVAGDALGDATDQHGQEAVPPGPSGQDATPQQGGAQPEGIDGHRVPLGHR
jgi:hypothetical protein